MLVGVNHPWHHCGWDFGAPPPSYDPGGVERAAWRKDIDARLARYAADGMSIVRWFVLADGTGYGTDDGAPCWSPASAAWEFQPRALPREAVEDFEALLSACERASLKLLPSLVGIGFFREPSDRAAQRVVKGGRAGVTRSPGRRAQFFDLAFEPLLAASTRHPGVVYAWEIVNEPEWVTNTSCWRRPPGATVLGDDMLAFIAEGSERARARGFERTVGFARAKSIDEWEARAQRRLGRSLDLSVSQLHHYPTAREPLRRAPGQRSIVGEIATRFDAMPTWPELAGRDSLSARLELARALGYEAVLLWSGLAPKSDRASALDRAERDEVRRVVDSWRGPGVG